MGSAMATLTELAARLEAIRAARDSGVLSARHGDTSSTFRTLDEMDRIIASIEAEIAGRTNPQRVRIVRINSGNSW